MFVVLFYKKETESVRKQPRSYFLSGVILYEDEENLSFEMVKEHRLETDLTRSIRVLTDDGLFLASAWGLAWGTRQVLMGNVNCIFGTNHILHASYVKNIVVPGMVGQSIVAVTALMFLSLALCYMMVFWRRKIFVTPLFLGLVSLLPIMLMTTSVLPSMQNFMFPSALLLDSNAFFIESIDINFIFYPLFSLFAMTLWNSDIFWVRLRRSLFFMLKIFAVCVVALKILFIEFEYQDFGSYAQSGVLNRAMFSIFIGVFLPIVAIYTTRKWLAIQENKHNADR